MCDIYWQVFMYGSLVAATTVLNLEYRDGFIFAVGYAIQLYTVEINGMHSNDIKDQIRARQRAYLRGDQVEYQVICAKVTDLIRNAKRRFYETKASNLRYSNSRKWCKSIFSLCGAHNHHTNITAPTKEQLQNVADQLLQAFSAPWEFCEPSACSVSDAVPERLDDWPPIIPNIGQVKAALRQLNPRKATGCDGIPAWLLKRFHEELAPVLHDIICASIQQSKYPTVYKHALVSPIPKVKNPTDIKSDFRQISVIPHVAKMLEKIPAHSK